MGKHVVLAPNSDNFEDVKRILEKEETAFGEGRTRLFSDFEWNVNESNIHLPMAMDSGEHFLDVDVALETVYGDLDFLVSVLKQLLEQHQCFPLIFNLFHFLGGTNGYIFSTSKNAIDKASVIYFIRYERITGILFLEIASLRPRKFSGDDQAVSGILSDMNFSSTSLGLRFVDVHLSNFLPD